MGAHLVRYYAALWIALGVVWLAGALSTKPTARSQSRGSRLGQTLVLAVAALLLSRMKWDFGALGSRFVPRSSAFGYAGLALTAAGIALAIWSRIYLGRNWSARVTVKQDHELMRSGPYSIVRHPIYSGLLVALAGTTLDVGEVHTLVGFLLVIVGLKMKANLEEQFMREEFGEAYARYQREVKSMIPFVW
jgi:protein-S-isoprenylcysteine O-methyltransferase Ste14